MPLTPAPAPDRTRSDSEGRAGGGGIAPPQADAARSGAAADPARHPRVVIVGGGFGGLSAAQALDGAAVEVLLLDEQNHHCFQPLLYQAATAALSTADIAWPIRHILSRQRNATVLMARVYGVDLDRGLVRSTAGELAFDWLVLATGSTHSYFGHEAWEKFAPSLKTVDDALRVRGRVLTAFERAETAQTDEQRRRLLTFAIVGGGPTGVELAGALAELAHRTLPGEFQRSRPASARILLVEAGPRLLPAFPETLASDAVRRLERMGVEVRTGAAVEAIDEDALVVDGARIEAGGAILWAAGVRASPAAAWIGAQGDRSGRVSVEPDLSLAGRPNVFVVGDTAAVRDAAGIETPGLAAAAKQMGRHAGRTIRARVQGRPAPGPFRYRDYGALATIGRNAAIASVGRLRLTGFLGWLFWSVVHIYFLIGLRSRLFVAASWAWIYLTDQRGARIILRRDRGPGV
ncbi:NADH dehydrogenase [Roseiarcus fermentans]|uniref:NADH dehydrogenase n=1 Tax=Roseiarcus fermentans TaxID=1473586 RepID=A0A366FHG4_9HYPH|nr:NAD(P)/FAD-dependent oxidoreductase [Roseiarcus fermentans]RBP14041.1 NADH dehydrogenase [Roseiarcus fermentans]